MVPYNAPLRDMHFVLTELVGLDRISSLPGCEIANAELVDQVLEEAARFARERLAKFKAPRMVVFTELPKTSTGKIQKFALRERAKTL